MLRRLFHTTFPLAEAAAAHAFDGNQQPYRENHSGTELTGHFAIPQNAAYIGANPRQGMTNRAGSLQESGGSAKGELMAPPLMPKATAVWARRKHCALVWRRLPTLQVCTSSKFKASPMARSELGCVVWTRSLIGQLEWDEIERVAADPQARLVLKESDNPPPVKRTKRSALCSGVPSARTSQTGLLI